jgi:hypothetical protein
MCFSWSPYNYVFFTTSRQSWKHSSILFTGRWHPWIQFRFKRLNFVMQKYEAIETYVYLSRTWYQSERILELNFQFLVQELFHANHISGFQFGPWIDVRSLYEVAIFFIQHLFRSGASCTDLHFKFQIISNFLLKWQESRFISNRRLIFLQPIISNTLHHAWERDLDL